LFVILNVTSKSNFMKSIPLLVLAILCNFITVSGQPGRPWQPFSAESPWNKPIPENPDIHPNSEAMVEGLKYNGLYINMGHYSVPVYYIDSDTVKAINVVNSRSPIRFPCRIMPWHRDLKMATITFALWIPQKIFPGICGWLNKMNPANGQPGWGRWWT